jgi:hypothetical protein
MEMVMGMGQPVAMGVRRLSFLEDKQWDFRRRTESHLDHSNLTTSQAYKLN